MALVQCNYYSQALLGYTRINLFLPTPDAGVYEAGKEAENIFLSGGKYRVLYLLHGMCNDYSECLRKSGIERYAEAAQIAVVMPDGENGFYANTAYGRKYETYIAQELPLFITKMFPVSDRREDICIGGFSMGGYGALRLGLKYSDTFGKVIALSGSHDLTKLPPRNFHLQKYCPVHWEFVNGPEYDKIAGSDLDTYAVAEEKVKEGAALPDIFLSCGTGDFLYQAHRLTLEKLSSLGIAYTAEEGPGYHNWDYWDPALKRGIDWLAESWRED